MENWLENLMLSACTAQVNEGGSETAGQVKMSGSKRLIGYGEEFVCAVVAQNTVFSRCLVR
jgi:hypothetical protein